jgi:ribosomal protein S18 acetylase RimI-like enzyme
MEILRRYQLGDRQKLHQLLLSAGDEWKDYSSPEQFEKYLVAVTSSVTYVMVMDEQIIGYVRVRDDDGFGVYIYDLLVSPHYRSRGYGKQLIDHVKQNYSGQKVYVMSDIDPYYEKLGYIREGSILIVI